MRQPSTRQLADLPPIEELRRLSQSLAMLDAVLSPEWEYRYYSFNAKWGAAEMMGSMRNGSGDEYFILFDRAGAAMKGFDHEAVMSPWQHDPAEIWPGIYDQLPAEFASFLNEPAFSISTVTFCVWRRTQETTWHRGPINFPPGNDPDGSRWMMAVLGADPTTYQDFAQSYYEVSVPLEAVKAIYAHAPLDEALVRRLNPSASIDDLSADVAEIGYPSVAV